MHEYERRWSMATGHSVRHPLRLKMERLQAMCDRAPTAEEFEAQLQEIQTSEDVGDELLADELLGFWRVVRSGGRLPFESR